MVSEGNIHGTFLFISYASTLDKLVTQLTLNGFADDHSVSRIFKSSKLGHKDELKTIAIIEFSMLDKKSWMDQVQLKMNESKTECIYFGGSRQLEKHISNTINVYGEDTQ